MRLHSLSDECTRGDNTSGGAPREPWGRTSSTLIDSPLMSFCGFVAFSNTAAADAARAALERWIAASASSSRAEEWTSGSARGYFGTFALAAGAPHFAELVLDANHALAGDVPPAWLGAPSGRERLRALSEAATGAAIAANIPDTDFSTAIWSRVSERLTLVRCPLGTRAMLYVCEPGAWIAFASLPEPLLALPGVKGVIDEAALPSQLIMGYAGPTPLGATLFARLRRLPAGHVLCFTRDALTVHEYWRLPDREPQKFEVNDPEVPRELRRLLEAAVRRRIAGVACVGTQLSGGLDSSAVTALAHAQRDRGTRVHAYTLQAYDSRRELIDPEEQRLARVVAVHLGDISQRHLTQFKTHRPFYLFQREYLERPLPDMVFKFGPDHRLLAAARADGCRLMLTGLGGDHMVSARDQLHVLAMIAEGRWATALENVLGSGGLVGTARALKRNIAAPLWQSFRTPALWSGADRARLLEIVRGKRLERLLPRTLAKSESWSVRRVRRCRVRSAWFQVALELQDWLGQRAGLAVHHPLLDREVIAFCDGMPPEWIAHVGLSRRAFRAALSDILPIDACDREKAPLNRSAAEPEWQRRYRAQHDRALHDLAASTSWLHEYLNLSVLAVTSESAKGLDAGRDPIRQLGANALVAARCAGTA